MDLKEVQDKSYELLCLIDDICRAEGVRYFLAFGTELGAVREKDIIPWDDDIDIKVLLEDYPAFRAAMEKHLPEHIRLTEPAEFSPAFYDFLVRITDDRYMLRRETDADRFYGNRQNRVGIDVFIQFRVPEGKAARLLTRARLTALYGMGMAHRYRLDWKKYSALEKAAVRVLSVIGKCIPAEKTVQRFYRVVGRLDRKPSALSMNTLLEPRCLAKSSWYTGTENGELRGRSFPLPAGCREELAALYGDYMSPPPDRNAYIQHLDEADRYREDGEKKKD